MTEKEPGKSSYLEKSEQFKKISESLEDLREKYKAKYTELYQRTQTEGTNFEGSKELKKELEVIKQEMVEKGGEAGKILEELENFEKKVEGRN